MSDEREPDEKERREAEALARALEGDGSPDGIPGDALGAAGLLRHARDGGDLPDERERAVLERVLPGAARPDRKPTWLRWALPAGAFAALVAIVALVVVPGLVTFKSSPGSPAALPRPSTELLAAQSRAASGSRPDVRALEGQMRAYRHDMYAALSRRYEGRP